MKLGEKIRVRVTEIDPQGRINLTARNIDDPFDPANPEPGRPPRSGGGDRGGDRGGRGGDRGGDRGGRGGDRGGRPGGYRDGGRSDAPASVAPEETAPPVPVALEDDEVPRAHFRPKR